MKRNGETIRADDALDEELEKLLKSASYDGVIYCPKCETSLEPDVEKCGECGWVNRLRAEGFI